MQNMSDWEQAKFWTEKNMRKIHEKLGKFEEMQENEMLRKDKEL